MKKIFNKIMSEDDSKWREYFNQYNKPQLIEILLIMTKEHTSESLLGITYKHISIVLAIAILGLVLL